MNNDELNNGVPEENINDSENTRMSDTEQNKTEIPCEGYAPNGGDKDSYATYSSNAEKKDQYEEHRYQSGTRSYQSNPDSNREYVPGAASYYTQTPPKKNKGNGAAIAIIICIAIVVCLLFSSIAFALGAWLVGVDTPEIPDVTDEQSIYMTDGITDDVTPPETLPDRSDVTLPQQNTVPDEYFNSIQVAANTINSVVEIRTEAAVTDSFFGQYVTQGAGSGVIITEDGFIATNYHVIDGATKIKVKLFSGETHDAVLWGYDIKNDLAVVKIEASGLSTAVFGNSDNLRYGEHVIAIGNPLGELGNSVSEGIVSAPEREVVVEDQTMTLIQIDAAVNPGNSGGGLFNGASELIGIVNAKSSGEEVDNIGFAIPSSIAFPILEDIIQNQSRSEKAHLGVRIGNSRNGVYISDITPGSDAEKAGLKVNDIILYVDDTRINSSNDLVSVVSTYYVGDKAKFVVYRNGKSVDITVEFTQTAE